MPPIVNKQTQSGKTAKKAAGVLGRIKPLEIPQTGLKVLLYGESGSGKTTFWSSFPKPILAMLCSGPVQSGELRSLASPEMSKGIFQVDIRETGEIHEIIEAIKQTGEYATIVLDHASGMQDLALKEILGLDDMLIAKYRVAGKGESWSVVSQQQYGQLALKCKEILRGLLNLQSNIVIIAQQRKFGGKDEEDSSLSDVIKPTIGAAMTPSVTGWLNPACDLVLQTYKRPLMIEKKVMVANKEITTSTRGKGIEYCLRTEPHDIYMTKFRLPKGMVLPECIVDPTYEKLMEVLEQSTK